MGVVWSTRETFCFAMNAYCANLVAMSDDGSVHARETDSP